MSQTPDLPPQNPDTENDDKVINLKLVTVQDEIRLDCIELLEDYLALAKAGKVVSLAIVAIKSTDNVCYGFSAIRNKVMLLGAADMLQNLLREEIKKHCNDDLGEDDEGSPEGDSPDA